MALALLSPTAEIGIVTRQPDAMLAFYRDTLGLPYKERMDFPGGSMHRLWLGNTILKLVTLDAAPAASNPPGGMAAATGYRYASIGVQDLQEAVAAIGAAGHTIAVPATAVFAGFGFAFVADPDGNWLELFGPLPS